MRVCSKRSSGSPVGIRTSDPLVNSGGISAFVFSSQMFRERSLRGVEGSIRQRKAEAQGNEISGLFLAYLCTCGTKCVLSCCRLSSDLRVGSYKNAVDTPGMRHISPCHNLGNYRPLEHAAPQKLSFGWSEMRSQARCGLAIFGPLFGDTSALPPRCELW